MGLRSTKPALSLPKGWMKNVELWELCHLFSQEMILQTWEGGQGGKG